MPENNLAKRLPDVKGRLIHNAPMATACWFQVGGAAEILFIPRDKQDLIQFLALTPDDIPVQILGAASNSLIRDAGIPGVTIRLIGTEWAQIQKNENAELLVGAGTLNRKITSFAAKNGLGGLEFFSGIPGMAGGAVVMNAGCHGHETKDVLLSAEAVTRSGDPITLTPEKLQFGYRYAKIPPGVIITSVRFRARHHQPDAISRKISQLQQLREDSQPLRQRTGGSTFANPDPPGTTNQQKAWKLLEDAGMRGKRHGGAQFSEKHCNFLINTGNATAHDLETLGEKARSRVQAHSGIKLRWEIRRLGIY